MNMFELSGIGEEQFKKLFLELKTCSKVAAKIGVSRKTVNKYAKDMGLSLPAHRPMKVGRPAMTSGYGVVASWFRKNKGKKLPQSVLETAKIIGTTPEAVYAFLKYRQKIFQKYVESFPALNTVDRSVEDIHGRLIKLSSLKSYTAKFDPKTMKVMVNGSLGVMLTVQLKIPLSYYESLFTL